MPSVKVPYMPIQQFDSRHIENETALESNAGMLEMKTLLQELPQNSTDFGREVFSGDVALILLGMDMEKYIHLFKEEEVNLETFCKLTRKDLIQIGITDSVDLDIIVNNLHAMKSLGRGVSVEDYEKTYTVPENHVEDLAIAKNLQSEIALIKCFASYTVLQMKKHKVVDYFLSKDLTAAVLLNGIVSRVLAQTVRISRVLYDDPNGNSLIKASLKATGLPLPPFLLTKLAPKKQKKTKKKNVILKIVAVVGLSSVAILVGKHIFEGR